MEILVFFTNFNNQTSYIYKSRPTNDVGFDLLPNDNYSGLYPVGSGTSQWHYREPFSVNFFNGKYFTFCPGHRFNLSDPAVRSKYSTDGGTNWVDVENNLYNDSPAPPKNATRRFYSTTGGYTYTGLYGTRFTALLQIPTSQLVGPSSGYNFSNIEIPNTVFNNSESCTFLGVFNNAIYVIGINGKIGKSTDNGASFTQVASFILSFPIIHDTVKILSFNANPIINLNNRVLYSTDDGDSWQENAVPVHNEMTANNTSVMLYNTVGNTLLHSTDGLNYTSKTITLDGSTIPSTARFSGGFSANNCHYIFISPNYGSGNYDYHLYYSTGSEDFLSCDFDTPLPGPNAAAVFVDSNFA